MLRLLFLTNLFPPSGNGGYEQWCQEVAEGLRSRGHAVQVLTSRPRKGLARQVTQEWVHRDLYMEMEFASLKNGVEFFTGRAAREEANLACLRGLIADFRPDLAVIWGMWNLSRALPALAESLLPGRVIYYLGDYWPTLPSQHELYWQAPAKSLATRVPKTLLKPLARYLIERGSQPELRFERVLFPSQYLHEEYTRRGVRVGEARVVYGAIDTRPFTGEVGLPGSRDKTNGLSLLYAGRLAPEKGIETALLALENLVQGRGVGDLRLKIAGTGERGYVNQLRARVPEMGLEPFVTFLGPVSKAQMPSLYRQADVFLFTSSWQEPFGRVLVEAMASGVVVVGTATGGAAEILQDGKTGLTFAPQDSAGLADQVLRLVQEPDLRARLAENGRRAAVEKFDIRRMVAEIDTYLQGVASGTA